MNHITQPKSAPRTPRPIKATGVRSAEIVSLDSFRRKSPATQQTLKDACSLSSAAAPLTGGDIWEAIAEQRIVMHYQPQYEMQSNQTVAAEALVRLFDAEGQLIYPARFIDMVEESDLIVPFGRAVIEQVCADLAACRADGYTLQRIAINLSANQLNSDTSLLEFTDEVVERYGLTYSDLEFELTERQNLTPNCEGFRLLTALAERGARIVIDDFGIGYSSITYLTELPITAFKLDRTLISRLPEDKAMQSVVKSLLMLAADLELEVVAEGIETQDQNDYLARAGCLLGQGFGYAKPMDLANFQTFLAQNRSKNQRLRESHAL
jgi:EAL domain-containing protein (putative c-di-GMP-specific phosphodiesterase class I)